MSPRLRTIKTLEENGWHFYQNGARHDKYRKGSQIIMVPRHNFSEDAERYLLQEAGIKRQKNRKKR